MIRIFLPCLLLSACMLPGVAGPTVDAGQIADAGQEDAGSDTVADQDEHNQSDDQEPTIPDDEANDPCLNQLCSGHGACFVEQGETFCDCEQGFVAEGMACIADEPQDQGIPNPGDVYPNVTGNPKDTELTGSIQIKVGSRTFSVAVEGVQTLRPDLYRAGHFSVFDALVQLHKQGDVALAYHFDEQLDAHLIDELEGTRWWWYSAGYTGFDETSDTRMDYFVVKSGTEITFTPSTQSKLEARFAIWRTEMQRWQQNGSTVVIPKVNIKQRSGQTKTYENVKVRPYKLRSDVLFPNVITAVDVLLSLAEDKNLSVDIRYHEKFGSATLKNYWVWGIASDTAYARCGFFYDVGESGRQGNSIHVPTDFRLIKVPQNVNFRWGGFGGCD